MANDDFNKNQPGLGSPARNVASVTPNDSVDLTKSSRALYVGVAGDIKITTVQGDTVTFVGVLSGTILPIRVQRVFATGTTATSIISLY